MFIYNVYINMNFNQGQIKVMNDFLNQISNEVEFEIRLGKFIFDKTTKKSHFESNV